MIKRLLLLGIVINTSCLANSYAAADGFGQVIQVTTYFNKVVGNPTWHIQIRDLDHGQTIPYLFDVTNNQNNWTIFTYSNHYLITASTMDFTRYQSRYNIYSSHKIENFCHLESQGRVMRGESMQVWIEGDLTPNTGTYRCRVYRFPGGVFAAPASS